MHRRRDGARLHLDQPVIPRYFTWLGGLVARRLRPVGRTPRQDIGTRSGTGSGVTLRLVVLAMVLALVLAVVVRRAERGEAVLRTGLHLHVLRLPVPGHADVLARGAAQAGRHRRSTRPTGTGTFYTIGDAIRRSPSPGPGTQHRRHLRAHDPADDLAGADHLRGVEPVPARLDARGAQQRLRAAGPGQGPAPAQGAGPARAAHRADPDDHGQRARLSPPIIGGAVITETVFEWRGHGRYLIDSIDQRDRVRRAGWLLVAGFVVIVVQPDRRPALRRPRPAGSAMSEAASRRPMQPTARCPPPTGGRSRTVEREFTVRAQPAQLVLAAVPAAPAGRGQPDRVRRCWSLLAYVGARCSGTTTTTDITAGRLGAAVARAPVRHRQPRPRPVRPGDARHPAVAEGRVAGRVAGHRRRRARRARSPATSAVGSTRA